MRTAWQKWAVNICPNQAGYAEMMLALEAKQTLASESDARRDGEALAALSLAPETITAPEIVDAPVVPVPTTVVV